MRISDIKRLGPPIVSGAAAACLFFCLCAKKTPPTSLFILGNDTLTSEQIALYDPSGKNDSIRLRNVSARFLCAGGLPDIAADSLTQECGERLMLITGTEWTAEATALLLKAAQRLYALAADDHSCRVVLLFVDSLRKNACSDVFPQDLPCDTANPTTVNATTKLISAILGVSTETATLLTEFVNPQTQLAAAPDSGTLKNMVADLVQSSEKPPVICSVKKLPRTKTAAPEDTHVRSVEALHYRNLQSIRDSIETHIPNLRELYKKHLKINASMGGRVVVTIQVDPAGTVELCTIKQSDIDDRSFLDSFLAYVRTIVFKPVPEKAGVMAFDFPFDFNTEM